MRAMGRGARMMRGGCEDPYVIQRPTVDAPAADAWSPETRDAQRGATALFNGRQDRRSRGAQPRIWARTGSILFDLEFLGKPTSNLAYFARLDTE